MSAPLLKTKLYIPPTRPELVSRPRLIERLDTGLHRKLTLVSAPAGFGKTTLVSEWVASLRRGGQRVERGDTDASSAPLQVAWLSLDESDNDPARFLSYLTAALQAALQTVGVQQAPASQGEPAGVIGEAALTMLQSPQSPPIEVVLTSLINDIASLAQIARTTIVLVLDDYHLLAPGKAEGEAGASQAIHEALTFLLQHLPPQMHLVVVSRSDPFFLPLPRLRARGQLLEIRADDLRFSAQEAATFLNQMMGLALSSDQVATLETRTEGWIAGLQLAALSMQGQGDAEELISAFAADDRYIADYLIDEVLARRPKGTKDFLLQTSILDRLTGPLCDAVTGQEGGQEVLQQLERANLFIVPLDNRRRWYRYHQLFADLLRQRLRESTPPEAINALHRRAGQWYAENDFLIEAVEHRLAAGDYEDVVRLIGGGAPELLTRSQMDFLLRWWAALPHELVVSQPRFCMTYAWAWLGTGHPERAERCLQAVERALGAEMAGLRAGGERAKTIDPATRGALVEVAVVRAQLAIERGDAREALSLACLVLPYLEDDEGPFLHNAPVDSRTIAFFIVGLAHKHMGDLDAAGQAFTEAAALAQERGNVHIVAGTFGHQAGAQTLQGHLRLAVQTCTRGLQLVQEIVEEQSPISGLMQVELGNLLYQQNDLAAALHHLQEGIAVAKPWNHWRTLVPGYTGLARARVAQGDWKGAFAALDELAALGKNSPQAVMPAVESCRAMLWAAQGKLDQARRWTQTAGLDVDGEIPFSREGQAIVLARVLMAQQEWNQAARLIARLLDATQAGRRWGRVIELLILRARVLDVQGKQDEALESLTQALTLAEPEGYVRVFVDEGPSMAGLLYKALSRKIAGQDSVPQYVRRLLAAFPLTRIESAARSEPAAEPGRTDALKRQARELEYVEPLSERELEVLQLVAEGLTNPEIASRLFLSLHTVKAHTRHIYGKLNVHNRTQAVSRARALGILLSDLPR